MILASIHDKQAYTFEHEGLQRAMEYLKNGEWKGLAPGRYPVDGDVVYALVQAYDTTPAAEGRMEAHRRYADVQFVAEGEEIIEAANIKGLTVSEDYNPDKDMLFFRDPPHRTALYLGEGDYAVLYPEDAHKPHCHAGETAGRVLKVVMKVRL